MNLLIQFLRVAILRELLRQFALNAGINDLAFQGGKVILVLALQGVDGVQCRKYAFYFFNDTLLLFFRWNSYHIIFYNIRFNPLLPNSSFIGGDAFMNKALIERNIIRESWQHFFLTKDNQFRCSSANSVRQSCCNKRFSVFKARRDFGECYITISKSGMIL